MSPLRWKVGIGLYNSDCFDQVMIVTVIRSFFLTPYLRILPCCLIVLTLSGCVGAGIPIPYPIAESINEWGEEIETKRQAKRAAAHQEEMVTYEAQREGFVACSPELKGVLCSETLKDQKKIKTKHLVVPGPGDKNIRQALKNIIPTSDHKTPFTFGTKYLYTTTDYKYSYYRYRLYKQWGDWLWDLEVRFAESDPKNAQQGISIMASRFQEVIE